jgi:hypothetical protein
MLRHCKIKTLRTRTHACWRVAFQGLSQVLVAALVGSSDEVAVVRVGDEELVFHRFIR